MKSKLLIHANKQEYGERYGQINFIGKTKAAQYEIMRSTLLADIGQKASVTAGGSKIHTGSLSPGCRLCVEGKWSCLFINNLCNARCFYCPTAQQELSLPATDNMIFSSPADYAAYLEEFSFGGVSFSGGEPLVSFERTVEYLKTVRKQFGRDMHVWMYTNGLLLTPEKVSILAAEGLDEIRFDISAGKYRLDKLRLATGIIPTVTVEIPAIPEDIGLLKEKIPVMKSEGADFLNLHQLRLTGYNFDNLVKRPYTFLHGTKVTVAESELAALEIIKYTLEQGIHLPVNYCSFVYKNRYQALAARSRYYSYMKEPWEKILGSGYLRSIFLPGKEHPVLDDRLSKLKDSFIATHNNLYMMDPKITGDPEIHESVVLSYSRVVLRQTLSYYYPYRELRLKTGMKVFLEKQPVFRQTFTGSRALDKFLKATGNGSEVTENPAGDFETIPTGLAGYTHISG